MAKLQTTTKENPVNFMVDICMVVTQYAESNNIRLSHLADEIYEYGLMIDEITLPDYEHINILATDDEDVFVHKIVTSLACYEYVNDSDFMRLLTGVWYALTKAELENMFND